MNQPSLFGDSILSSLRQLSEALGGLKKVGYQLWPDLSPDKAQQRLIDALNPNHRTQLDPERFMAILRMGHEKGLHTTLDFICDDLGYERTKPVNTEQQVAELQKDFLRAVDELNRIHEQIQKVDRKGPARAGNHRESQRRAG